MTENTNELSKVKIKSTSESFFPLLSVRYIAGAIFLCLVLFAFFYGSMIPFDGEENIFEIAFTENSEVMALFIAAIYFSFLFLSYWILILVTSIVSKLVDDAVPEIYNWAISGLFISYAMFSIIAGYHLNEYEDIYSMRVFYILIGAFLSVQLYYRKTQPKMDLSNHSLIAFTFSIIISIICSLSPLFASGEDFSFLWMAQYFGAAFIVLFFIPLLLQLFGILSIHRQESQH